MRFTGSISLLLMASIAAATPVAVPEPNPGSANVIQQRSDSQLSAACSQFTNVAQQIQQRMASDMSGWQGQAQVRTIPLSIRYFC
jgi:hypothetical protein